MEELWCLGIGEQSTDYVLCDWDSDLLPTLYNQDNIRYEYNQGKQSWSKKSCTIFAAIWMLSDLMNYRFTLAEIKEIDNLSYERGRIKWEWRYVQSAVKLVADWWNEHKKEKVAYYRISKHSDMVENSIKKNYTLEWNYCPTAEYNKDWMADGIVDWTEFGENTNWHAVDIASYEGKRSVKNSYEWREYNVYGLKNPISAISNFWPYVYIYTKVKEDNLEEIKRLNEIKSECTNCITHLWELWHLSNSENFKSILHYTADKIREKIKTCDEMLMKLQ